MNESVYLSSVPYCSPYFIVNKSVNVAPANVEYNTRDLENNSSQLFNIKIEINMEDATEILKIKYGYLVAGILDRRNILNAKKIKRFQQIWLIHEFSTRSVGEF